MDNLDLLFKAHPFEGWLCIGAMWVCFGIALIGQGGK